MIHPLKAATSFDCDGCGHHASFHRMESRAEEETARRWAVEREGEGEGERVVMERFVVAPEKKKNMRRRRIGGVERDVVVEVLEGGEEEEEEEEEWGPVVVGRKRKGRGGRGRGGDERGTVRGCSSLQGATEVTVE